MTKLQLKLLRADVIALYNLVDSNNQFSDNEDDKKYWNDILSKLEALL